MPNWDKVASLVSYFLVFYVLDWLSLHYALGVHGSLARGLAFATAVLTSRLFVQFDPLEEKIDTINEELHR